MVEHDGPARSWALFNSPARPGGLVAAVESAEQVVLRWRASPEPWVVGYNVYRLRGAQLGSGGRGTRLNTAPVAEPTFIDADAGLADGVVRMSR